MIPLVGEEAKSHPIDPDHIFYLMQSHKPLPALQLYEEYKAQLGRHDFEVLQQIATIILEQGIHSSDPEIQLMSLYGSSMAGLTSTIDILAEGIKSRSPETQMASIQFLAHMQDDRCDELLTKAMSSDFLMARLESGYHLSARKHLKASGQIESLMHRMPVELRAYFPQFFALIGTKDAMIVLRQLIEDRASSVRIEAILSGARARRDDLLPKIRAHATHSNVDEQEACAAALGLLKDSQSIPQLKRLLKGPSINVQLAAAKSLYTLGDMSQRFFVEETAKSHNLFAIALLGDFAGSGDTLAALLKEETLNVRWNAAISLLKLRDPRALPVIEEILIKDSRDLGFQPNYSIGHSLLSWKVIPSVHSHMKQDYPLDLFTITAQVREALLVQCLELPENAFLHIAHRIFDSRQTDLIPVLVSLLENHQTQASLEILKKKSQTAGAPYIRAYCTLALYRLHQEQGYEDVIRKWIGNAKDTPMFRFRPLVPFSMRQSEKTNYELTPEESSRLLIEAYEALASRHDEKSLNMLIEAIRDGHPKNRYVLAGLLIQAIQ
jgi:HEAT repeat protein